MEEPYQLYLAENKHDYGNSSQAKTLRSNWNSFNDLSVAYSAKLILLDLCLRWCSQVMISKLLFLQKCALRLIYYVPSDAHVFPLFIELKILLVKMIYCKLQMIFMHDIGKRRALCLLELFSLSEIHGYNKRLATKETIFRKSSDRNFQTPFFLRTEAIL